MLCKKLLTLALTLALGQAAVATEIAADPTAAASDPYAALTAEQREQMHELDRRRGNYFDALSLSTQPRDWARASQLHFADDSDASRSAAARASLVRSAAAAAPDDATVQWLALTQMPSAGGGCRSSEFNPEAISAVLRVEPDNAMAWLPVLQQAVAAEDDPAIDATLARMASAGRFDDHSQAYLQLLLDTAARYPRELWSVPQDEPGLRLISADDAHFLYAYAEATSAIGNYSPLLRACDSGADPTSKFLRLASCGDLGRRMSREASTALGRKIGFAVVNGAGQQQPDDAVAQRDFDWWQYNITQIGQRDGLSGVQLYRTQWLQEPTEIGVWQRVLRAEGIAPRAPDGWHLPPLSIPDHDGEAEGADASPAADRS